MKQEQRFRLFLDAAPNAIVVVGQNGTIEIVNAQTEQMFGYNKGEMIGQPVEILIPTAYKKKHPKFRESFFLAPQSRAMGAGRDLYAQRKDKTDFPVEIGLNPMETPEGKMVVASIIDISERKKAEEQRELLSSIVNSSDDAIISKNTSSIITTWNHGAEMIFGYTSQEVIGQHISLLIPSDRIHEETEIMSKIMKGQHVVHYETQRKRKDGNLISASITVSPLRDSNGKIIGASKIVRDTTERIQNERILQRSLKEISDYKHALDKSAIVAITDQRGVIKHVNENFCKISKYRSEELVGQDHRIINSGYHPKEYIRDLWTTIAHGKVWKGELKNKAKDGTVYWVDTTIVPFLDDQGKPYQYVAIRADITDRKQAETEARKSEEKLRASERIYRTIALNIPGSVISLFDTDYRCFLVEGDRFEKFGYPKEQLLGKKLQEAIAPDLYAAVLPDFKRVFNGESFNKESDRGEYQILSRYAPLKDDNELVYAAMVVTLDITELKKAERITVELNIGLEQKVKERTEQLNKVNKELEAFSYSVSHDLRAPLRAVNGYARMLEEDYDALFDANGKRLLKTIQQNATKMGQLIDDLLTFSRMGRKEIQKSSVSMISLVEEALKELDYTNAGVEIKIGELSSCWGDSTLLKQVLVNYLSNAIKYSSKIEKPVVQIKSIVNENEIIYSVSDNGTGFDMTYVEKLFKVFQRLHRQDEFEGTGVGLAIVDRIIGKHGGRVWAESEAGKGATFYFSLPKEINN